MLSRSRVVARNTVRTLLERMEAKGWFTHRQDGCRSVYAAAWPREATVGQKVRKLVETVCGGSPETLLAALLDDHGLRLGEPNRVRRMLAEGKAGLAAEPDPDAAADGPQPPEPKR